MNKFLCALMGVLMLISGVVYAQAAGNLFPELGRASGTTKKQKETKDAGLIRIVINDVQIVNPPMNGVSFCIGSLTAENNTNVMLNQLVLTVKYGDLDVPISFGGVGAYSSQKQAIAFAGDNCKSLLSVPAITVNACVAGPMTLSECQSKIKYVPIS